MMFHPHPDAPQPAAPKPDQELTELEGVAAWRLECLLEAGYDWDEAKLLALSDVDIHDAGSLLQRGCPRELALEILA